MNNTPNDILLIERITGRQLNFFKRFKSSLVPGSSRSILFAKLIDNPPAYLHHYIELEDKYSNCHEIHFEYIRKLKDRIRLLGCSNVHYKYKMYPLNNPNFIPSPFVNDVRYICNVITKFRLGSHRLPNETGRWCRKPRHGRLCETCNVLGDESHFLFRCSEIDISGLNLPQNVTDFWHAEDMCILFTRIISSGKFIPTTQYCYGITCDTCTFKRIFECKSC